MSHPQANDLCLTSPAKHIGARDEPIEQQGLSNKRTDAARLFGVFFESIRPWSVSRNFCGRPSTFAGAQPFGNYRSRATVTGRPPFRAVLERGCVLPSRSSE